MKIKSFMTMMMAAVAIVLCTSSCSSSDDEPEAPIASQVVGSYEGPEVIMVMGELSSDETKTYSFSKSSDVAVDITVPASGESGMMMIPSFTIKNVSLTKVKESFVGKLDSYSGTVTNTQGQEKAFTVSDLFVDFEDVTAGKAVLVTFSLKYGNMPMAMDVSFSGTRQKI